MPVEKSKTVPANRHVARVQRMQQIKLEAKEAQGDLLEGVVEPAPKTQPVSATTTPVPRKPRAKISPPSQADIFAPVLYDVGARDSRSVMDVAPFRLSKSDKRPNAIIRYDLPDGHVQVYSAAIGMASVFDYDLVLMAISNLTEAMNKYREGKGEKPGQIFRPNVGDIIKFCRKENGGNQRQFIVGALERLSTTHVGIKRTTKANGTPETIDEGENLIGPFKVVSVSGSKKIKYVEIKIADWMYEEITRGSKPDVLTVHPDYFLHESGISRFLYRLARKAAGKDSAVWGFDLIFTRSGSTGSLKEFSRALRKIIEANDVPEYDLAEEPGQRGPKLRMIHRSQADKWKDVTPPADGETPTDASQEEPEVTE